MTYMDNINQYGWFDIMGQGAKETILTPALCRAARGLLDWTQVDLADHAAVSRSTIRDYEGKHHELHRATEAQLRLAFENGGVAFIEVEGKGTCICLRSASE
ncbi:transcriptional regulator [Rhizobium sp. S163]|uniref:transcriptional regulator n=1 Tax=Rhizobium sp. S163 TaxID=3055039 RepID=UPI0025A96D81|nr:transcriptional regulator [Rhizobium sp. S163]MDM9647386.1 transcriptional regulator [Rhizobium sp. S163]